MRGKTIRGLVSILLVLLLSHHMQLVSLAAEPVPIENEAVNIILETIASAPSGYASSLTGIRDYSFTLAGKGNYSFTVHDKRDELIIVRLSCEKDHVNISGSGVIDSRSRKVILPFKYDLAEFIPGGKIFVSEINNPSEAADKSCYIADAGGALTPVEINGNVIGVDKRGYITLVRYEEVDCIDMERPNPEKGAIPKMALLDDQYNMVLDYIAEGVWPAPINFIDDMAIVQTGGSEWRRGARTIESNGKFGVIDRSGRFIIKPVYDRVLYMGYGRFYGDTVKGYDIMDSYGQPLPKTPYAYTLTGTLPSEWALDEVTKAHSLDLVKTYGADDFNYRSYRWDITRQQFCELAVGLYEKITETSAVPDYIENSPFTDTRSPVVAAAYEKGITTGRGEGIFDPFGSITRQEAATMLNRLAKLLGVTLQPGDEGLFADDLLIADFAKDAVYSMLEAKVMNGVGGNRFDPLSPYTVEQSIITTLRLYYAVNERLSADS